MQLSPVDLTAIAQSALESGYLGTAARVLRTALPRSVAGCCLPYFTKSFRLSNETRQFKRSVEVFRRTLVRLNNGYMEKSRSVVTDKYVFSQYLLDENLKKKSKQPKFIREGKHMDYAYIGEAVKNDGMMKAKTNDMLRSCGGGEKRMRNLHIVTMLERSIEPAKREGNTHSCRLVHHQELTRTTYIAN